MESIISQGLEELGLAGRAAENAPEQLARFGRLLLEKNRVMNLTAIREPEDAARLHMLDCAALLRFCDFRGRTLIDVGTGAGFPGMALKILEPSLEVTLLDSLEKRLGWLEEAGGALGLKGVRTVRARAEELGRDPEYREAFDFASARAVARLGVLCELCLPYVKVGGAFLAMKSVDSGPEAEEARHAAALLGGELERQEDYPIPGTEVVHRLVVIRKVSPTPPGYPRRWARIQKAPLWERA